MNRTIPSPRADFRFGTAEELKSSISLLAFEMWEQMDRDQKSQILYTIPDNTQKETAFHNSLLSAAFVCFLVTRNNLPCAAAWLNPCCPGAQTAAIHLACAGPVHKPLLLEAGRLFLNRAGKLAQTLITIIPKHFFGPQSLALALGFKPLLTMHKAFIYAKYNKLQDCILYAYE